MTEAPAGERRNRWGVPVAEVVLVVAVWGALQLASSDEGADAGGSAGPLEPPAAMAGFRSDAFYLPDDSMLGFVEIPAGPVVMGSNPAVDPLAYAIEGWSDTQPQGVVDVPTYYLGRYEVTVAEYEAFVLASGHVVADPTALEAAADHPVASVSWTDALAYARWLDQALRTSDGTPAALAALLADGWHVTLPTEAQWAKGARDEDGRVYPWGNELRRDRAVFAVGRAAPVGSIDCPECAYGLSDMAGNVWEWTRSPYQPYPYDDADDAEGLDAEALWVIRGGGFGDSERDIRAANRGGADPGARRPFIGFRVALTR